MAGLPERYSLDASTKASVSAVAADARECGVTAIVLHNATSNGMEAASNIGCRAVDSRYLTIHDDDDTWEPGFLAATTAFLDDHADALGVITQTTKVSERLTDSRWETVKTEPYMAWVRAVYLIDIMQRNLFPPISFLFRREIYDRVGGFNEALQVLGDWDFNIKVLRWGNIGVVPLPLGNYHLRDGDEQGANAYANTVTHGTDKHVYYDAFIRNQMLREDLDAGSFGLGTLASLGRQHVAMWGVLDTYRRQFMKK